MGHECKCSINKKANYGKQQLKTFTDHIALKELSRFYNESNVSLNVVYFLQTCSENRGDKCVGAF